MYPTILRTSYVDVPLHTRLHAALLDDDEDDEDVADDAEDEDDEIEEDDEAAYPRLVDQVLKIIW